MDKFWGIVDAKNSDSLSTKVFSEGAESNEMLVSFITGFHQINGDVSRVTTNKENKVAKRTEARWKGTTDVAMNSFEKASRTVRSFLGKGGSLNVCLSTSGTRV